VKTRRSRAALEDAVDRASSACGKAIALYELALFHDNNSREAEAVPLYEEAIRAGLPRKLRAEALTWLASSLYKTDKPKDALRRIHQARDLAPRELEKFLDRLEARVIAASASRRS
jgi:tetratricopeptide (TPR) repeat protein